MDKRKLNKVVRDVKKILVLARLAHNYLEKNQIRKARSELKKVMSYVADEITRLHDENEGMAHQLLHECGVVLKDAKQALRALDSSELFDKAKELVDEIVKLEGHELIELEEEEEKENEMYNFWHDNIRNFQFSHTTSSIIAKQILKDGLDPNKRLEIFKKGAQLNELLRKYAHFGCSWQSPTVFERKYLFVSPLKVYVHYKVPESIDILISYTERAIEQLGIVFQSRGNFAEYARLKRERGEIFCTEDAFRKISFSAFRNDFDTIRSLFQELRAFEQNSTSVTLLIDNQALSGILPKEIEEVFSSFDAFKKSYAMFWPLTRPSDMNKHIIDILRTNEIRVTKRIHPKHIHLMKE